ncbi:MAG: purine-binding chemotaxis protein CheW [Planctomycetes bacterium]|nr:purine-binding chemotaxis protein CheW [Planctomycetota bacterium]
MTELSTKTETDRLDESTRQFLVFSLEDEEYGIEIMHVQEIKSLAHVAPIPNAPEHVKGVLNLRGTIIPIVDLRLRFSMPPREYDRFTVIIVVAIENKRIGLVVDGVSDVLEINVEDIDDSPPLTDELDATWFRGVGKPSERLVFLLDVPRLTRTNEVSDRERLTSCSN